MSTKQATEMKSRQRPTTPELQREIDDIYSVQLDHVTKDFGGGVLGLDDVNVGFKTGGITVLLGLSGSGKSTLLRHINGLHSPSSGHVRVLGRDVRALSTKALKEVRRDIGVIFQAFNLVGPMSVLENVCAGALGTLRGPRISLMMYPKAVRREAIEKLDRVGLADEPVASLDPVSAIEVINLLRQIAAEDDLTIISSLHQVPLAIDFADRIVGLRSGRAVLDRTTEGLSAEEASQIYTSVSGMDTESTSTPGAEAAPRVGVH